MYLLLIDLSVNLVMKSVRTIVMTGVVMVKDMMTHITGIHEEICLETWKKDVTMAT